MNTMDICRFFVSFYFIIKKQFQINYDIIHNQNVLIDCEKVKQKSKKKAKKQNIVLHFLHLYDHNK